METINYKGTLLAFKVEAYDCGDYGAFVDYRTVFYNPIPKVEERKKYFLFGKKIEVKKFEELFTIGFNIMSKDYTKQEVREALDKQLALLERKKDINEGRIV